MVIFAAGKPFYVSQKFLDNGLAPAFNLPAGEYHTGNTFKKLSNPVKFKVKIPEGLPKNWKTVLKKYGMPKFQIRYNENKASIDVAKKLIIIDPYLADRAPAYVRDFVLFHELGHIFFPRRKYISLNDPTGIKAESLCDEFAAMMMIEKGYNPSQCFHGINKCLTDMPSSVDRKINMLENYSVK